MAFYSGDEEEQTGQPGGAPQGAQSGLVTGGGQMTNAPAEKAATPAAPKPAFVGIKEYLNANKPQTEKLGETVNKFVDTKVQGANQKLAGAQGAFGQDVDKNTVRYDENIANEIRANPMQLANDQAKVQQIKSMQKGYAGPQNFQESGYYQSAKTDLDKAQNAGQNLQNQKGQRQVLNEYQQDTRGGRINRGAATLDSGLLGASKEARAKLQPAIQHSQEIPANLQAAIEAGLGKVKGAKDTSAQTNAQLSNLFNEQFANQQSDLENRAAGRRAQDEQYFNTIKNHSKNLSDSEAAAIGIDKGTLDDLKKYGIDVGGYGMDYIGGNFTGQNVANQDDYARAQALAQLSGVQNSYLDPNQLGKGSGGRLNINQDALKKEIARKKQVEKTAAENEAKRQAEAARLAEEASMRLPDQQHSTSMSNAHNR